MGLFRGNNTVTNFWLLFATLSVFVVIAEVSQRVDREALPPVASKKNLSGSSIVVFHFSITRTNLLLSCFLRKSEALRPHSLLHERILRVLQDAYFSTESKIGHLTCQSRFCLTEVKSTSTCVIVCTIPKMKLVISRAIYSKNKTTHQILLPNFALMIK